MFRRPVFFVRHLTFASLGVMMCLTIFFLAQSTVAFQKAALITPIESIPVISLSDRYPLAQVESPPDLREMLAPIPYQNSKMIYDILPSERYRQSIQMGIGNCSNLVFGMAYRLLKEQQHFQIVHLIPFDGFLKGSGHSVLNMPFQLDGVQHTAIVDLLEGGIPLSADKPIELAQLEKKHLDKVVILPLNERKDTLSNYYGSFLNRSAIGVVLQADVERYFSFVEKIYVPLGNKKLERVLYGLAAMIFNQYPHTYVSVLDYQNLFGHQMYVVWCGQLLLWLFRLTPVLLFLQLTFYILNKFYQSASDYSGIQVEVEKSN